MYARAKLIKEILLLVLRKKTYSQHIIHIILAHI